MIYLAYIALIFLGLQFLSVVMNLVFRQGIDVTETQNEELISVLIPTRNEEENIATLLSDLQKVKGEQLEIIVFDDESMDKTKTVVRDFAKQDPRIVCLESEGLPEGWMGKNHACFQMAQKAHGKHLLFLDADVRIDGNVIADATNYLKRHRLKLLSIMPRQMQKTWGERLSVPIMNYILLTLLPLVFVRYSPFASHVAAVGQFMLFDAETYRALQPHQLFRNSAVEDMSIARHFKKKKLPLACTIGEERVQCRMYSTYTQAVQGFSKNVLQLFGNVPLWGFLFLALSAGGFVPVWLALPQLLPVYFVVLASIIILYSVISRQNSVANVLLFLFHLLFLAMILGKACVEKKYKNLKWKERNIFL